MSTPSPPAVLLLLTDGPGGTGGIARYNMDLIEALSARPDPPALHIVCRHGVPDARVPAAVRSVRQVAGRAAFAWAAWRAARRLPPGAWLFCGHLHFAPLVRWIGQLLGLRWWLQVHGVEAWQRPSPARARAVAAATLVTAVSRVTRRRLLRWAALAPARVVVLPNTVGGQFQPPATPLPARTERVLLTVGRLHPDEAYKGQDRVIRLLPELGRRLGSLRYWIAGSGGDQPRLERLAVELGVRAQVEFLGAVIPAGLPALYAQADLFILPSTGEGFGISFLEAMACGTPALGLDADGSVDPLADGALGTVVAEARLLEAVEQSLESAPAVRGPALADRVQQRFGQPRFREHVQRLLQRMAIAA